MTPNLPPGAEILSNLLSERLRTAHVMLIRFNSGNEIDVSWEPEGGCYVVSLYYEEIGHGAVSAEARTEEEVIKFVEYFAKVAWEAYPELQDDAMADGAVISPPKCHGACRKCCRAEPEPGRRSEIPNVEE